MHIKSMKELIKKYKAVSQECRLRIINLLVNSGTSLCICEMMDILQKEQYQISRCLSILKDAGLVEEERDGRLLLYSLKIDKKYNKTIFENISSLKEELNSILKKDIENMHVRLLLRENGRVVVTYK